jgi:hypothetical protein
LARQKEQIARSTPVYVPSPQSTHSSTNWASVCLPAAQRMQSVLLAPVPAIMDVPAGQVVHDSALMPAPKPTNFPATQSIMEMLPPREYLPTDALTHPASLLSYFPAAQFSQEFILKPAPTPTDIPSGQSEQTSCPCSAYVLTTQGVQLPFPEGILPIAQNPQNEEPTWDTFPLPHGMHSVRS